jgi:hypothetical protein
VKTSIKNKVIRIEAATEVVARRFAVAILPYLGIVRDRPVHAAMVSHPDAVTSGMLFSNIAGWSFGNAVEKTEELRRQEVNTLLLSGEYISWKTANQPMSAEVKAYERYLRGAGIDVVTMNLYGCKSRRDEFQKHFNRVPVIQWVRLSLQPLGLIIAGDLTLQSLTSPLGGSPCVLIDPGICTPEELDQPFKILAWSRSSSHRSILEITGHYKPPFINFCRQMGFREKKAVPMPAVVWGLAEPQGASVLDYRRFLLHGKRYGGSEHIQGRRQPRSRVP